MKFTLTQNEFHMAASSLFERSNLTESNRIMHSLDLTATGINAVDMVKVFICMTKTRDLWQDGISKHQNIEYLYRSKYNSSVRHKTSIID